ncbi:beta-microseminoprotein [Chanos chanos]|uniref:Beta-microseminoprotein n=1 Tax=Chanos chanos TaxID=29144 RepID=A0A6J2VHJ0_CHACN|nr:beta-microseminoprotein-like [Chanos chanos]
MMERAVTAWIFCALLALVHTVCVHKRYVPGSTHCYDDATERWHPIGSKWKSDHCQICSCYDTRMSCCTTYANPANFPDDCMKEFDQETCSFKVFKKNNPSIPCPVSSYSL